MNIKQIEKKITEILTAGGIELSEAKIEAKMLMKHFLNISDNDFILDKEISDCSEVEEKAKLRAESKRPIQHIIGFAEFMGAKFKVNENVLIPRDETEFLVRKAVEMVNKISPNYSPSVIRGEEDKQVQVLDIGTGTGCIACMIAKLTSAQVKGVDISTDALQVALENAAGMELFNRAIFRKSDLFSNINKGFMGNEFFDIIVSNPPYIPPAERANIQEEVKFDPELALYTEDEKGLEFYERITKESLDYLKPGGYLLFELGIDQAPLVKKIMEEHGFKNIGIEKDLAGIERIIWGNL